MTEDEWISCKDQIPKVWEWVFFKNGSASHLAYRTIFGNWRFKSGLGKHLWDHDYWRPITIQDHLNEKIAQRDNK